MFNAKNSGSRSIYIPQFLKPVYKVLHPSNLILSAVLGDYAER